MSNARQGWPELMIEVGEALEALGPIRAAFTRRAGLILDGRYEVTPAEVIEAARGIRTREQPQWGETQPPGGSG